VRHESRQVIRKVAARSEQRGNGDDKDAHSLI
jgi:hypothetical protein